MTPYRPATKAELRRDFWSRWPDAWLTPEWELLVGCVLLVFSGWWWFVSRGAIWEGWQNILSTLTVVLGPWFVHRAWKRKT